MEVERGGYWERSERLRCEVRGVEPRGEEATLRIEQVSLRSMPAHAYSAVCARRISWRAAAARADAIQEGER